MSNFKSIDFCMFNADEFIIIFYFIFL